MPQSLQDYPFQPTHLYRSTDPELRVIAARSTMAHWRQKGIGPPYIRMGTKVLYPGYELNNAIAAKPTVTKPHIFTPNKVYRSSDERLSMLATRSTMAKWRHTRTGPEYSRYGRPKPRRPHRPPRPHLLCRPAPLRQQGRLRKRLRTP